MNVISATFGDDNTEITFIEDHENTPLVKMVRLVVVHNTVAPEQLAEIKDLLQGLIDESLVQIRVAQQGE